MTVQFRANLTHLRAEAVELRAVAFALNEAYSAGWSGTCVIVGKGSDDEGLSPGSLMSALMASGVLAGTPMCLNMEISGAPADGLNVRSWPCVVSALSPYAIDESTAACNVGLIDPITSLAEQPVWGAYRAVSAVEAVGGALSLAAGGDGKPNANPILPGLPPITVVADHRDALERIPYAIASGRPFGDWLADVLAMLGLRAELRGYGDGRLRLTLSDRKPGRKPLEMSVVTPAGADPASTDSSGPILIRGHSAFPGAPVRGALLDDPTKGTPRPLVAHGAIGTVLTDSGLDIDEAAGRLYRESQGRFAEMLMLRALSRQPRMRPGETVRLSRATHGLTDWQVTSVSHTLRQGTYDNDITLIRGDVSWHPDLPLYRPPVYVSAVVDGGNDFDFHQPVPRDRLGRIKVTFPFTPTPSAEESLERSVVDSDGDRRITMADFSDDQVESFTDTAIDWDEETAKYDAGDYDDPYPGKADEDLTVDEKERREELQTKREAVIGYRAYTRASRIDERDADRDGVVSERDRLVSDDLREALRDDERRQKIEEQWAARDETPVPEGSLAEEYGELFGELPQDGDGAPDARSEAVLAARVDAADAADRWPARIPLPVIKPMAGALHGFIVAHRHGDTCRVAVHHPFSAEIVGFQYRDDRRINTDLNRSVAGLVVEHNYSEAWSGLVFRRAETLDDDSPLPEPGAGPTGDDADDPGSSAGPAPQSGPPPGDPPPQAQAPAAGVPSSSTPGSSPDDGSSDDSSSGGGSSDDSSSDDGPPSQGAPTTTPGAPPGSAPPGSPPPAGSMPPGDPPPT